MSAVKPETWAHELLAKRTSRILQIKASTTRAITANENLKSAEEERDQIPALVNLN